MARSSRTLALGGLALVAIALVIALTSDSDDSPEDSSPTPTAAPTTEATTTTAITTTTTVAPTTTLDPRFSQLVTQTSDLIERVTPEQLAYRLVVTGLTGTDLAGRLRETVGSVCVGGVFLTESNNNWTPADDVEAFRTARTDLGYDAFFETGCEFPPLVTTDAELGSIVRVPVESPLGAPDWGRRYVEGDAHATILALQEQSASYAKELADLGIDVNFGAVADVDTDPTHFMAQSGRTFGDDPGVVAPLVNAFIAGHCDAGVAAALKHFPNQGATTADPHRQTSTADGGVELWETTGRLPYESTIAPIVMVGHIFIDHDPDLPASMSPTIIRELLRDGLGYDGLVITDDLSVMRGAIDVIPDAGDRAVAAIRAGADMVLFVDDRDIPVVVDALVTEMNGDPEFFRQAQVAFRRILRVHMGLIAPELFPLCSQQG